jgi:hypothetical protein
MEKLAQRDLATVAGIFDKLISDGRLARPSRNDQRWWRWSLRGNNIASAK